MEILNCWEFKKCRRNNGGSEKGPVSCPVVTEKRLDGIHRGKNAGRACWVVPGTTCDGDIQGTFSQKIDYCFRCDFYKKVQKEEHPYFHAPGVLLQKIR
jgi:hypothetical protein